MNPSETVLRPLRDYQEAGLLRYADYDGAFFAMALRLGKTLTTIRWLDQHQYSPRKILIIAPKTVLVSWEDELTIEGKPWVNMVFSKLKDRLETMRNPEEGYHLCNYETISALDDDWRSKDWKILTNFDAVILDESVCIKNAASKCARILVKASSEIKLRACLSGIPNPESWADIWPQLAFANGGSWMGFENFYDWRSALFCNDGHEWWLTNASRTAIKKQYHEDVFTMTRHQAGIRDMKIRQKRIGEMDKETRAIYKSVEKTWCLPGEENEVVDMTEIDDIEDTVSVVGPEETSAMFKLVVICWLRRICGGVLPLPTPKIIGSWKTKETIHILKEELPNDSVVVWCAFNLEISLLKAALIEQKVSVETITGATPQEYRREYIHAFRDRKIRVLIIQQKCGQYGIDLSAADTAIYYSCHYSYNLRAQSEERIFRVGKEKDMLIIDLITKDTVDETIQELIKEKKNDASLLLARLLPPPGFEGSHQR